MAKNMLSPFFRVSFINVHGTSRSHHQRGLLGKGYMANSGFRPLLDIPKSTKTVVLDHSSSSVWMPAPIRSSKAAGPKPPPSSSLRLSNGNSLGTWHRTHMLDGATILGTPNTS